MTYFGTNIKKIRQIKGLSQQAFADLLDLTRGIISSYEEGRAEPKIETLLHISHFFNLTTDELISKPLTVNQLANFSEVEELVIKPTQLSNKVKQIKQLNQNGEFIDIDLQKILEKVSCIHILAKNLVGSPFLKNDTLFLTDGKGQSNGEYIYFENQTIIYTDVYVNKSPIYKIVGHLSEKPKLKNSMKDVLTRLEKLESLIKSN
jgi:transcriptional regulator with XRE-family HTH domain